jgi:cytochrome c-type biogenesis protein CcmE
VVLMAESDLDRELAQALERPVGGEPASPAPKGVVFGAKGAGRRGAPLVLAGLLVLAGGIVAVVMTSLKGAAIYSKSVDEVVRARSELAGRRLRVDGNLVHGSIERRDKPCEHRFKLERGGSEMLVHYPQCVVPDTFRDVPGVTIGVTVEGNLTPAGDFEATQIMAKCPSKYDTKTQPARAAQMPYGDPSERGAPGR